MGHDRISLKVQSIQIFIKKKIKVYAKRNSEETNQALEIYYFE